MERLKEQQMIEGREIGIALLLGPSLAQMLAIQMIEDLHSLAYSRDIEFAVAAMTALTFVAEHPWDWSGGRDRHCGHDHGFKGIPVGP
jgi:hypothetical protein